MDLKSGALPTELSRPTHLKVFLVTGAAFVCWSCIYSPTISRQGAPDENLFRVAMASFL